MKLYLISQPEDNLDYDTFDSAVICADDEDDARMTHPRGHGEWDGKGDVYGCWCDATDVTVKEIGLAHPKMEKGVICASFNAG